MGVGSVSPEVITGWPARYGHLLPDGQLECRVCPRHCRLRPGQRGLCFVRGRSGDELVLTTYVSPVARFSTPPTWRFRSEMTSSTRRHLGLYVLVALALAGPVGWSGAATETSDELRQRARETYFQEGPRAALPLFERVLQEYRTAGDHRGEAITLG